MYLTYFGLRRFPFENDGNLAFLVPTAALVAAERAVDAALVAGSGVFKLIAPGGAGKTLLCRKMAAQAGAKRLVIHIGVGQTDAPGLCRQIAASLGVESSDEIEPASLMPALVTRIIGLAAARREIVLLIDSAERLTVPHIHVLLQLYAVQLAGRRLVKIVLIGRPALDHLFALKAFRPLKQAIGGEHRMGLLRHDEVRGYLFHRLLVAGYRGPELFTLGARNELVRSARGIAENLNLLAHQSLLTTWRQRRQHVLPELANFAVALSGLNQDAASWRPFALWALPLLAVAAITAAVLFGDLPQLAELLPPATWQSARPASHWQTEWAQHLPTWLTQFFIQPQIAPTTTATAIERTSSAAKIAANPAVAAPNLPLSPPPLAAAPAPNPAATPAPATQLATPSAPLAQAPNNAAIKLAPALANAAWPLATNAVAPAVAAPTVVSQAPTINALPATPAPSAEDLAYQEAQELLRRGEIGQARDKLRALLKSYPKHIAARQTLLTLLLNQQRNDEASYLLEDGLANSPQHTEWAIALARLQYNQNQPQLAARTLAIFSRYAKNDADYYAQQGFYLQQNKRPGEAVERYRAALALRPGNALWWYNLGQALDEEGKSAAAGDAYMQARDIGHLPPEIANALNRRLRPGN